MSELALPKLVFPYKVVVPVTDKSCNVVDPADVPKLNSFQMAFEAVLVVQT